MQNPSVVIDSVGLTMPDGTQVLEDLTTTFRPGVTGLIGRNGLGKSVLLRLVAGELSPTAGTITAPPHPAVLPQHLTLQSGRTVADLLGVETVLAAIEELTTAEPTPERAAQLLEAIGEDWDAADTAMAALTQVGMGSFAAVPDVLRRTVGTLSGGEAMLVALAGLRRTEPELTLLDEPTNNLDAPARERLAQALGQWPGTVIVASHDQRLLETVDAIAELRPRRVRSGRAQGVSVEQFGGFEEYLTRREAERSAARRRLAGAQGQVQRESRLRQQQQTRADRSAAQGRRAAGSMPKILANRRKAAAERTASQQRTEREDRLGEAREAVLHAQEELAQVETIDVDLPGTALGAGSVALAGTVPALRGDRVLLDDGVPLAPGAALTLRGPERVGLTGPNGAGKSTLLRALLPQARVPVGVLRQRTGVAEDDDAGFDESAGAASNLLRLVPGLTPARAREVLARLALRGDRVDEPVGRLSGGERFRVDLARVVAAEPAPQLLVLDEPSNDLDLESLAELAGALRRYGGAVLIVSHDAELLAGIGLTRRWEIVEAQASSSSAQSQAQAPDAAG